MKNIILQHWTGEMDELGTLSSANISKYAEKLDADYELLRGNVFRPNLSPPCQKIYMLDETFDEYDIVVMMDIDMFTRKGMENNIFTDETGIGMAGEFEARNFKGLRRKTPILTNPKYPFWGGAIYRLDRETRQKLRVHIRDKELVHFSGTGMYEDEGIMHRLATCAKLKRSSLSADRRWCHCSYRQGIENSAIIHIRTKVQERGSKRNKIENYRDLVDRGLIEE